VLNIRDRITELRRVPASELIPNPHNWRQHPTAQWSAVRGVLDEIGFADALIARETPLGLQLIDGHLRAEVMGAALVPVLIVDLDQAEADQLLATLDPLAAMATRNQESLSALLERVQFDSEAVNEMLANLVANDADMDQMPWEPDIAAVESFAPSSEGLIPVIKIQCPQEVVDELKDALPDFLLTFPGAKLC